MMQHHYLHGATRPFSADMWPCEGWVLDGGAVEAMTLHALSPLDQLIMSRFRERELKFAHRGAAAIEAEFAFEVTRHMNPAPCQDDSSCAGYVRDPLYWDGVKVR
jgi:hypothetical protein